jgi:hypothetical protein
MILRPLSCHHWNEKGESPIDSPIRKPSVVQGYLEPWLFGTVTVVLAVALLPDSSVVCTVMV